MNTFRYTDAEGNLIGPLSKEALAMLKKTGAINDDTQVLDESTKQMSTLSAIVPKTQVQDVKSQQSKIAPSSKPSSKLGAIKGAILDYSIQTGEGIISGDDNNRYKFAGSEWKASEAPARGQRVDFDVVNGRAVEVFQEQSPVPQQRLEKPQAFTPSSASNNSAKGKTNQHAGKRGVLGVVLIIFGLFSVFTAKKDAGDVAKTYFQSGQQGGITGLAADDALAKAGGYNSMEDYMADQNRSYGIFFVCLGAGLIVWGYKKYYNSPVPKK